MKQKNVPLQILADQLTLSQPGVEGHIMPTTSLRAPSPKIFRPSYSPAVISYFTQFYRKNTNICKPLQSTVPEAIAIPQPQPVQAQIILANIAGFRYIRRTPEMGWYPPLRLRSYTRPRCCESTKID